MIGGILLKIRKKPLSIISFYARRILRIWPLYYLLVGLVYFLGVRQRLFVDIPYWSFFLFVFNFWESNGLHIHPALGTLWSLAIEEQFYAVGPLIFLFLERKQLTYLTVLYIILSPFLRLAFILNTSLDTWRFTLTRLDGISMGILLSILLSYPDIVAFLLTKIRELKRVTLLLLVLSLFFRIILPIEIWYSFGNSLMVLLFGFLLITVIMQSFSKQKNYILNWIVLQYLGLRCYNIYLFHIFLCLLQVFLWAIFLLGWQFRLS